MNQLTKTFIHVSYLFLTLTLVSCTTIELKNVPVYHEAKLDGEVFCNAEVLFVTGEARCVPDKEFQKIKETALIIPATTYFYFRGELLKACRYAQESKTARCNETIKSFDDVVQFLWQIK